MTMLLIAGIAVLAAGLLAVAFGIPVKEFSFGNTLILAGAVAACTGVILLGLAVVVRELQNIARRLGPANSAAKAREKSEPQLPVAAANQPAPETQEGEEPGSKQPRSASAAWRTCSNLLPCSTASSSASTCPFVTYEPLLTKTWVTCPSNWGRTVTLATLLGTMVPCAMILVWPEPG